MTLLDKYSANEILLQYGLHTEIKYENSDTVKEGLVSSQDPSAGEPVISGSIAKIYVSEGKNTTEMPDVIGQTRADAAKKLKEAGISAKYSYENNTSEDEDTVTKQSISAGSEIKKGTTVILTINTHDTVSAIPNLIGMDAEEAEQALSSIGLKMQVHGDDRSGAVTSQSPSAGLSAAGSSYVTVTFGSSVSVPASETAYDTEEESTYSAEFTLSSEKQQMSVGDEFVLKIVCDEMNSLVIDNWEYEITSGEDTVISLTNIDLDTLALTFKAVGTGTAEIAIKYGDSIKTCEVTVS